MMASTLSPPLSAKDSLRLLASPEFAPIDVRSEGEFAQGHLPGFTNLPVLRDPERHEVGLTYKTRGQDEAIRVGHMLVEPDRARRIEAWTSLARGKTALVTCWRGGLRSKIATQWISEAGARVARVEGGYKAMRAELLLLFESPGPLCVLSGFTGSGKTELIRALPAHWSLDLERMARHRGSSFGRLYDDPQPQQATFENRLGLQLFLEPHEHLVEDESIRIGMVSLPAEFKKRMIASPLIVLDGSVEERSDRIFSEYVAEPLAKGIARERLLADLQGSTAALERRLGGALAGEIRETLTHVFSSAANDADPVAHREWIAPLLTRYYDKFYRYSIEETGRNVAFRGNWKECREWIGERFGSLKP